MLFCLFFLQWKDALNDKQISIDYSQLWLFPLKRNVKNILLKVMYQKIHFKHD